MIEKDIAYAEGIVAGHISAYQDCSEFIDKLLSDFPNDPIITQLSEVFRNKVSNAKLLAEGTTQK